MDSRAVMCHLSALGLYAGGHDLLFRETFYTGKNPAAATFAYRGVEYKAYALPARLLLTRTVFLPSGASVRATTREQAAADAIDKPERSGGLESVFRRLDSLAPLDCAVLAEIALGTGKAACARVGWVAEAMRDAWGVDGSVLSALASNLPQQGAFWGAHKTRDHSDRKWKLYLPEPLEVLRVWIVG